MRKMPASLQVFEAALFERCFGRPPVGRAERVSVRLLLLFVPLLLLSLLPGALGKLSGGFAVVLGALLASVLFVLAFRWVSRGLLWTVRNRLIVTCLLMGLAPVVLFGVLAGISAYVFSGQFATNTALAALNSSLAQVHSNGTASVAPIVHVIVLQPGAKSYELPVIGQASEGITRAEQTEIAAWWNGKRIPLRKRAEASAVQPAAFDDSPPPHWLRGGFSGVVERGGALELCATTAFSTLSNGKGNALLVVATAPLDSRTLTALAEGLGTVRIMPGFTVRAANGGSDNASERKAVENSKSFTAVQAGQVPAPAYVFDPRVFFSAPLHVAVWETGLEVPAMVGVISRPTLLYQRLFANSVRIGAVVRTSLISITILFSLLELLAFLMAVRLSRTITHSIADLYSATKQIDHGNLQHRIRVERHDQLAALATSFNTMTGSLANLLEQQREKERLLSELEIAQEVQNNLFPRNRVDMPRFELHGICKPARTVSGDYYDFILEGESKLCLALGDISGKGISAALLMASLHSAVRAYRLAGDELEVDGTAEVEDGEPARTFASPGKLLALLNRHLYASTQPEKYATLFFACYDSATRKLTYSNGGQLPPLVLCADGTVKRLDCGGSVVGLLEGLAYQEATVSLAAGDIVIAYSDGVTEPENEFGEFGEDRLLEVIRNHRHQSLAAISNHAMRALRSWIGEAEQPDDITLVLARQS